MQEFCVCAITGIAGTVQSATGVSAQLTILFPGNNAMTKQNIQYVANILIPLILNDIFKYFQACITRKKIVQIQLGVFFFLLFIVQLYSI